jgi:hypothetical protein
MIRSNVLASLAVAVCIALSGCASQPVEDPVSTLSTPSLLNNQHKEAIALLAARPVDDEEANKALERAISGSGYTIPVRERALDVLAERDLARAKRTLRNTLPNSTAWAWIERASAIIAERGWIDLTPALVSSWARPAALENDDFKRPEYLALAELHGEDKVVDVVFETFRTARSVGEQGLRSRCWDLLYRLGQRERLVALINSSEIPADDAFLLDLQAAARDLGVIPHNREEILWLRKLRQPENAGFWSQARTACETLSPKTRAELEIRDLPVVVSAFLHDQAMLAQSTDELYARVEAWVNRQKRFTQQSNFENFAGSDSERLYTHKTKYTWGDLAAMLIAIRAMQVPEVVSHLFDYAKRDREDVSSEFGGVISLDSRNRFEVLEFPPVIREHDQKFIASQDMLDSAYTAIFHFHFHVQQTRNDRFAGPGFGDINYADNVRANCLVLTSVGDGEMNIDYYRHDRVVVDLGTITLAADAGRSP